MALDLELRRSGFTSTEMAAVFGVDPERDLHAVWARKKGGLIPEPPTWRMRKGHYLEPGIIAMYADYIAERPVHGEVVPLFDVTYRHPKYPHVLATPDALVGKDGGVDAKTAGWDQRHQWGGTADDIPDRVQLQMVTCMEVMERDYWDIALLNGDEFRVITMERDREFGLYIMAEAERIWQDYFEGQEPPPIGRSQDSERWLKQTYPKHKRPDLRVATDEEIEQLRRYGRLKHQQKELKKDREGLENWLRNAIQDREGLVWDGGRFTWRLTKDSHEMDWESLALTLETRHMRLPDNSARDEAEIQKLREEYIRIKPGYRRIWFSSDEDFAQDDSEEVSDAA